MAGSMGTIVGLPMAQRRPDLFSAYVGTDFYVDMVANERQGRRDTLERLRAAGNQRGVAALEASTPTRALGRQGLGQADAVDHGHRPGQPERRASSCCSRCC